MRYFLILFLFLISFSSCYMVRAYKVRKFKLNDHERMPFVVINKAEVPFKFIESSGNEAYSSLKQYLDSNLKNSLTAGFIVIRNDSIIYENYFNGFSQESLLPSFSVAKSFVATLVAVAVDEGTIKSVDEPITNYIPELYKRDKNFSRITIQHLLDMRSGLDFDEGSYGMKDDAIKLGFRPDILKHALKVDIKHPPGGFEYQSINTFLLAIIIERTTGKPLVSYLEEKLWKPLGAEYNATLNIDHEKRKQAIAYAGLNATIRDFAKLGKLYLDKGKWQGKEIIKPHWVQTVSSVDSMHAAGGYRNQFWSEFNYHYFKDSLEAVSFKNKNSYTGSIQKGGGYYRVGQRSNAFHAEGILKQIVYINSDKNLIIVRFGRNWSHKNFYAEQFVYMLGWSL